MSRKCFIYLLVFLFAIISISCAFIYRYFIEKPKYSEYDYNPLISVLVTSYNYDKYIQQTLDSILNQTYKNYEVIVVDDGSTDNSVALISKYVKEYKKFHLYQHRGGVNKGFPASIKLGIEKAKGDYVAFLESDDYWAPDNLLEKVKTINKNNNVVIISNNIVTFGEDKEEVDKATFYVNLLDEFLTEKNIITAREDLFNYIPTFSAVMIQRDILKNLDYDTPIPAFLDLYLYRQILAKYPLYYIKKQLTYWRRHIKSFNSNQNQPEHYAKAEAFLQKLKEIIEK